MLRNLKKGYEVYGDSGLDASVLFHCKIKLEIGT